MSYVSGNQPAPGWLLSPDQLNQFNAFFSRHDGGDELPDRLRLFSDQLNDRGASGLLIENRLGDLWEHYTADVLAQDADSNTNADDSPMFAFDASYANELHSALEEAFVFATNAALEDPERVKGLALQWLVDPSSESIGFATNVGPDTIMMTLITPTPRDAAPPENPDFGETRTGVTYHLWKIPTSEESGA
jgi:hypothetical protein